MNPFATHIPALLACLECTSGPVLELGSGWFSTPIVSAFLCTNSTKGGTAGTLYSVGAFSGGDKSLGSGDSLSVQGTFTQADDGV